MKRTQSGIRGCLRLSRSDLCSSASPHNPAPQLPPRLPSGGSHRRTKRNRRIAIIGALLTAWLVFALTAVTVGSAQLEVRLSLRRA